MSRQSLRKYKENIEKSIEPQRNGKRNMKQVSTLFKGHTENISIRYTHQICIVY